MILRQCFSKALKLPFTNIIKPYAPKLLNHRFISNLSLVETGQQLSKIVFLSVHSKKKIDCPTASYNKDVSIIDKLPLLNFNLPCIIHSGSTVEKVECPPGIQNEVVQCKNGILKIRRKKMNKHKLKKRRKRDRAQIRKVLIGRERNKRKVRAYRKKKLIQKIENIKETHPGSDYAERPYVIHRLRKW